MFLSKIYSLIHRFLDDFFHLNMIPDPDGPSSKWPDWKISKTIQNNRNINNNNNNNNNKSNIQSNVNPFHLRILSMNVWALPVAPDCIERIKKIGEELRDKWDIISFQEVWHRRERNMLIDSGKNAGYPHYHYFQSAIGFPIPFGADAFGTGLLILSRFPIIEALFHRFSVNGRMYALHESDYIANKGVGLLRMMTPVGFIDVYVTHLLANYNQLGAPGPGDWYLPQRAAQSYELASFINATFRNDLIILCGDFNSPADCVCLKIPLLLVDLKDAFTEINEGDGITFASNDNKYSHGEHPMRMDYILYKINTKKSNTWNLVSAKIFKQFYINKNGEKTPVSDHFGVTAEFKYVNNINTIKNNTNPTNKRRNKRDERPICTDMEKMNIESSLENVCNESNNLIKKKNKVKYVNCLKDVYNLLKLGQLETKNRRQRHLKRALIGLLLLLIMIIWGEKLLISNTLRSILCPILLAYIILEYVIAFYATTLEYASFSELMSQVQLQLQLYPQNRNF